MLTRDDMNKKGNIYLKSKKINKYNYEEFSQVHNYQI